MSFIKSALKKLCHYVNTDRERETLTPEEIDIRRQMFDKYQAELLSRELANSQQYDKAILTLSSAGFAVSVTAIEFATRNFAFTRFIVNSWWWFFAAITLSIMSFVIGNFAIKRQIQLARDYYIEAFKDAGTQTSIFVKLNSLINLCSGISFLIAVYYAIKFFSKSIGVMQ